MLTKETQVEISVLHRQGKSIREISRETGCSRNTVRTVLRGQNEGVYGPREGRPRKLDAYRTYIGSRIAAAAGRKLALPATVLLRELQERGYDGGITQLREYAATLWPVQPAMEIVRFETPPGKQMQIDFVVFRRGERPLRAFTSELGYSRFSYVEFTDNERCETLIACLERAFEFFGGVPQHILCDNPKTIVLERDAYAEGVHRYHPRLLDFTKHYGTAIKLCAPYRPQTKGKVERFHRYVRESFFEPLQSLHTDPIEVAHANREVRAWLEQTANPRIHATLKERPCDRFLLEQPTLSALPPNYCIQEQQTTPARILMPVPVESMQHPLAIYDELVEGMW